MNIRINKGTILQTEFPHDPEALLVVRSSPPHIYTDVAFNQLLLVLSQASNNSLKYTLFNFIFLEIKQHGFFAPQGIPLLLNTDL